MKNMQIKKCTCNDGTVKIVKIFGGNVGKKGSRKTKKKKQETGSFSQGNLDVLLEEVQGQKSMLRNESSLRRIMQKGRDTLNFNIVEREKTCLMFRLGYFPHNFDHIRVSADFERFIRRVRDKHQKQFGKIHYFAVIDMHQDMSFHLHGIFYAPCTPCKLWFKQAELESMWERGSVWVNSVKKHTQFDYILPIPSKSNSQKAVRIRNKFNRYLTLPKDIKIARNSGFVAPKYECISLAEYTQLKATTQQVAMRKTNFDYGYGIATYVYETFLSGGQNKNVKME